MDVKNLIMAIIGIVIAGLMIGAALLPAVDSATKTNMDVEQNTTMYYSALKDYGEELVITPTGEGLVIDGESYATARITSDNYFISYFPHSTWFECNFYSLEYGKLSGVDLVTLHKNGTITVTIDETNYTTTIIPKFTFVTDKDGDWGEFRNTTLSVTYGQKTYACHIKGISSSEVPYDVFWSGEFINGVAISASAHTFSNDDSSIIAPIDDFSIVDENITRENGHYDMHSSVKFTLGTSTYQDDFGYVFAPIEYKVETQEQSIVNSIFALIPLIASAGLVMAGIYVFISRK